MNPTLKTLSPIAVALGLSVACTVNPPPPPLYPDPAEQADDAAEESAERAEDRADDAAERAEDRADDAADD